MHTFVFASSVCLFLQTKLPFYWWRAVPKNIGPSLRTFKPMAMQVSCTIFYGFRVIMTSKAWFGNFYGNVYGILIWEIVIRNVKSTFFKNSIRKCYYSYHKSFEIIFLWIMLETTKSRVIIVDCKEALTSFKFENVY